MQILSGWKTRGKNTLAVFVVALAFVANASTYYVSNAEVGEGVVRDGSEDKPFETVADAVAKAKANDEVVIAEGDYPITTPIIVNKAITVRGATGNPDDVVIRNVTSPASGGDANTDSKILILSGNGRIQSVTMKDGCLSKGNKKNTQTDSDLKLHGSIVSMSDGVLTNCVISGGYGTSEQAHSPGVYTYGTAYDSCRIEGCVIRNNFNPGGNAITVGGGVCVAKFATITGCVISNNLCRTKGGGIGVGKISGNAVIKNCVIVGNYGGYNRWDGDGNATDVTNIAITRPIGEMINKTDYWAGYGWGGGGVAGVYNTKDRCTIVNSLIAENYSRKGSDGADLERRALGAVADAKLYGCTVISNVCHDATEYSKKSYPDRYVKYALDNCEAVNTIVYGNTAANGTAVELNNSTLSSCCASSVAVPNGNNNINSDPQLEKITLDNGIFGGFSYALKPTNEALVDAGNGQAKYKVGTTEYLVSGETETDLAGNPRKLNTTVDIGCYETLVISKEFGVLLDKVTPACVSAAAKVNIENTDKDLTLTLIVATDEVFTSGVVTNTVSTAQHGAGTGIELSFAGLQKGTHYWMKVMVEGQEDTPVDSNVIAFKTAAKPYDIKDDLTIDDRGITISLDKIYDGAVLSVAVTVDGRSVTLPNGGVYPGADYSGYEIVLKSEDVVHTSESIVVVDVTCMFDGENYTEHYEMGRALYVATSGSDTGRTGKWKGAPLATVQEALKKVRAQQGAGTTNIEEIVILAGTYLQNSAFDPIVVDRKIRIVGEESGAVTFKDGYYDFTQTDLDRKIAIFQITHKDAVVSGIDFLGREGTGETHYFETRRAVLITDGVLENSKISNFKGSKNLGSQGAGVSLSGGTLRNSLITKCQNGTGANALYITGGRVENCTIAGNTTSETVPAVYAGENATIVNSIISSNSTDEGASNLVTAAGASVTYTCVTPLVAGRGNIDEMPFVDAANGNYRLKADSLCVDKGKRLSWFADAVDLAGNPRVRGNNRVDLGCYESDYKRLSGGLIILVK